MFRSMRRSKQLLSKEKAAEILQRNTSGTLAVLGDDDYPYTVPMDFVYENGKLFFHCAQTGHKLDAIARHDKVSFCVMDEGFRREGEWALNIRSVICFGRLHRVTDPQVIENHVRKLGLKYNPDPKDVEREIRESLHHVCVLALDIEHMTGKIVNES